MRIRGPDKDEPTAGLLLDVVFFLCYEFLLILQLLKVISNRKCLKIG